MNTTNDSDNGAPVRSSEKQRAANRANAKKSTGPKTAVIIKTQQTDPWTRMLWAVQYEWAIGRKKLLLGTLWEKTVNPQYNGEPIRCLLFTTRKQARAWCRKACAKWHWTFQTVRVKEEINVI